MGIATHLIQPGSLIWLLGHELRLWWRDLRAKWFLMGVSILMGLLAVLVLVLWVTVLQSGGEAPVSFAPPLPLSVLRIAGGMWLFFLVYTFIQAMQQSLTALFDRGDLDLLISSPMSPKILFAGRLLGVTLQVFFSFFLLLLPITILTLMIGAFRLLGVYPAMLALCLTSASLSMLLTLWLVRLVGARRARTVAQVLTMALAGIFFLGIQIFNLTINTRFPEPGDVAPEAAPLWNWIGPDSWIWFPVKSIFLDVPSLLLTLAISSALAWFTVETLNREFISGTQQPLTEKRRSPTVSTPFTFRQGLGRVFLLKEWRVIWRSPYLISRTILSVVFLIPLILVLMRGDGLLYGASGLGSISTVALPTAGAFLTSSLAVVCIAGEEAPDLLKSAPVNGDRIRILKLLAVLLPVWALLSLFFGILLFQGVNVLPGLALTLLATGCTALIRLWNARPISLAGMMMRQRENAFNDTILGVLESILFFLWVVLGIQTEAGQTRGVLLLLLLIGCIMAIAYWRSRALGTSLGF